MHRIALMIMVVVLAGWPAEAVHAIVPPAPMLESPPIDMSALGWMVYGSAVIMFCVVLVAGLALVARLLMELFER